MLLTASDLTTYGFRISGTPESAVTRAIEDAEFGCVKRIVGDENYIRLLSAPEHGEDHILLNGGLWNGAKYIAGLKMAEAHLAFAILLHYNCNSTSFGSVRKTDDHSRPASYDEVKAEMETHLINFEIFIREVCNCLAVKFNRQFIPKLQAI